MRHKRKYSLLETSVVITAGMFLTVMCLLMTRLMGTAAEYAAEYHLNRTLNETVTPMIETVDSSVKADKMLYSVKEEAGVYDNTPEAETAEMAAVEDEGIRRESNNLEIEVIKTTEWHYYITAEEIRLVALIAELEDRGAMSEIAETILNRVNSPKFPDSITEVIYQPKQFQTIGLITEDMMPSNEGIQAVEAVFRDGQSTVGGAVFFAEKSIAASSIAKGLYLIEIAGGTAFYNQK